MQRFLEDTLRTTAFTSAATTLAAALAGKTNAGSVFAPFNATSHILWGDAAARRNGADFKHTAAGAALNTGAMLMWSSVFQAVVGKRPSLPRALLSGAGVAALAWVVDYHVVPKRLTPGFEKRLSRTGMVAVFGALAAGLGVGALLADR